MTAASAEFRHGLGVDVGRIRTVVVSTGKTNEIEQRRT